YPMRASRCRASFWLVALSSASMMRRGRREPMVTSNKLSAGGRVVSTGLGWRETTCTRASNSCDGLTGFWGRGGGGGAGDDLHQGVEQLRRLDRLVEQGGEVDGVVVDVALAERGQHQQGQRLG